MCFLIWVQGGRSYVNYLLQALVVLVIAHVFISCHLHKQPTFYCLNTGKFPLKKQNQYISDESVPSCTSCFTGGLIQPPDWIIPTMNSLIRWQMKCSRWHAGAWWSWLIQECLCRGFRVLLDGTALCKPEKPHSSLLRWSVRLQTHTLPDEWRVRSSSPFLVRSRFVACPLTAVSVQMLKWFSCEWQMI